MAELARLGDALRELAEILDALDVPYMVIGGVANLIWGEPRTTQDIDITLSIVENQLDQFVASLAGTLSLLPHQPLEFFRETKVLPVAATNGVRIDLIRAGLPYEESAIRRAQVTELAGALVRVVTAEDLIVHKLVSARPRDREDAQGVIRRQRNSLDRVYLDPLVQSIAELLEQPEIWDWYVRSISAQV